MSLWKRGDRYWTDFAVEGRRYRKSLRTSKLNEAKRLERDLIEAARSGGVPQDESGPKTLAPASAAYLSAKKIRCSRRTIELEEERLSIVRRHFGDVKLSAITAASIAEFQRVRHEAGIANLILASSLLAIRPEDTGPIPGVLDVEIPSRRRPDITKRIFADRKRTPQDRPRHRP